MLGSVRTKECCPNCSGDFEHALHPYTKEVFDLMCPGCKTRPRRLYVDARGFSDRHGTVGRLYFDRNGHHFESFQAAQRTLESMRREVDENRFDSSRWSVDRLKELKLSRTCDPWLEHIKRNRSEDYHSHQRGFLFKWIIPTMGDLDVRTIRGIDVEKLHADLLKQPIKPNTIRNILTTLRTLMNWLLKQDVIDKVPSFPPLSPIPRENVGWIERETQDGILVHARQDVRLLFETMMETGIRPGEAVALKVRDLVDGGVQVERAFDRSRKVKETKTGAVAWKVISEDLFQRLVAATKDRLPEAWIFTSSVGTPFAATHISMLWARACKAAGVKVCLYVAMRHSRVSQKRKELERRLTDDLRRELSHTSSRVTLKHYVRDGRELMSQRVPEGSNSPL